MTSRGRPYKAAAIGERIFLALADRIRGPQLLLGAPKKDEGNASRPCLWEGYCVCFLAIAGKRLRTEELLEALMLRMDAMD
ncbi:hypothetical protein NDU88_004443 [Pleurodeles waltl]|uniref:Uncharacterized protein n=1 Tax=Pleurodeles waltl TaxID=8319 RepID=A0AAV7WAD8_PLEWA|nr:hypothetical protein NDU88_004443 [Pleurodeles waltl]